MTVFYESASELATLTATFRVAGVLTDPTTVTLTVTDPAGAAVQYSGGQLLHPSTGFYSKDVSCTADGVWIYTWVGTGAASDVVSGTWTVVSSDLGRLYCSVEELKSRIGLPADDEVDDLEIRFAIESASRWIDAHCQRPNGFWRGSATRYFQATSAYRLDVDDLISVTTLRTDDDGDGVYESTWDAADFQLLPVNAVYAETRPYTQIKAISARTFPYGSYYGQRNERVEIVGVFGQPAVPAPVKEACLMLAAEGLKLKDAPFGTDGFAGLGIVRMKDDPKVLSRLAPYRLYGVMVG